MPFQNCPPGRQSRGASRGSLKTRGAGRVLKPVAAGERTRGASRSACGLRRRPTPIIDQSKPFAHLTAANRQAVLEILRETKKGLPAYWRR
jgi:hypothetical protein